MDLLFFRQRSIEIKLFLLFSLSFFYSYLKALLVQNQMVSF